MLTREPGVQWSRQLVVKIVERVELGVDLFDALLYLRARLDVERDHVFEQLFELVEAVIERITGVIGGSVGAFVIGRSSG